VPTWASGWCNSKPGGPGAAAKWNVCFALLQQDFEAGLRLPGQAVGSLEELNGKPRLLLQEVYHPRVHDGIGESPQERFARALPLLRPLDPHLDFGSAASIRASIGWCARTRPVRIDNDLYELKPGFARAQGAVGTGSLD